MTEPRPARVSLFGAPGSNTNLGLNALMQGTLWAGWSLRPNTRFTVFDNELGVRDGVVEGSDGPLRYRLVGARLSRRVTRPESYAAMTAAVALRLRANPGARAVRESDVVLDVSGGDSFSDIYGEHRFRTVCAPKRLALLAGRPLVLLPQTYGPFSSTKARRVARSLVLRAEQAWARDADSYSVLSDLLGDDLDPRRHRLGVDLAMMLPPAPDHGLDEPSRAVLERGPVGVNVSGLLWNAPEPFGLRADYRVAMQQVVVQLVARGHEVVLVPHVLGRKRGGEADNLASDELLAHLDPATAARVVTAAWFDDAARAKAAISRCSFFVGTRMHSAIAALSSGTPCCAVAYSAKYRGVFAGLGVPGAVLDARSLSTTELVESVLAAVDDAEVMRDTLASRLPRVLGLAQEQMQTVLSVADRQVSSGAG